MRVHERVDLRAELRLERRRADRKEPLVAGVSGAAFDLDSAALSLGADFTLTRDTLVELGHTQRKGDVVSSDGRARIANLPPGEYVLQVWHPRMEGPESATAQRMRIGAAAKAAWTLKLKPDLRPRRAPHAHTRGYR